jgi:hypothetical protein
VIMPGRRFDTNLDQSRRRDNGANSMHNPEQSRPGNRELDRA